MKFKILSLTLVSLFASFCATAQEVEDNVRLLKPFKADGISSEWNEPLSEFNDATRLAFALANDDHNLYLIIESLDPQTTFSVLRGGITLNINTEGKKKKGINLVFPFVEQTPGSKDFKSDAVKGEHPPIEKDQMLDPARRNTNIQVSGFKSIPDGALPVPNAYGIETGMSVGPNKDLIYELCIPFSQLGIDAHSKKPLVYNIKINAPAKPDFKRGGGSERSAGAGGGGGMGRGGMGGSRGGGMGGGGRSGGMGGGGRGQRPSESGTSESKSSDFWIKFKLAA